MPRCALGRGGDTPAICARYGLQRAGLVRLVLQVVRREVVVLQAGNAPAAARAHGQVAGHELCFLIPTLRVGRNLVLQDQVGQELERLRYLRILEIGVLPVVGQRRGVIVEVPGAHAKRTAAPEGVGKQVIRPTLDVGDLGTRYPGTGPRSNPRRRLHALVLKDLGVVVRHHVVPGEGVLHLLAVHLQHRAQGRVHVLLQHLLGGRVRGKEVVQRGEDFLPVSKPRPSMAIMITSNCSPPAMRVTMLSE